MSEPTPSMKTPPQTWKQVTDGSTRFVYQPDGHSGVSGFSYSHGSDYGIEPKKTFNFTAHFTKSLWIFNAVLGAILIALAAFLLWPKPPAAEVTPDQSYITQVRAGTSKLGSIDDTDLISLGHKACNARKQGMSQEQTLLNVMTSAQDRTLRNDLAYTIGAAYAAYCPEYTR